MSADIIPMRAHRVVTCRICGGDHPWQRCGNDAILARESSIMRETREDLSLLAKTIRTLSETFAMGRA